MAGASSSRPWAGPLQRALRFDLERAVGESAVERGFITPSRLAEAADQAETTGDSLTSVLLGRGWLDAERLAELEDRLARADLLQSRARSPAALPPEAEEASRDPARHLAEFVLVARSGRGGTGAVWKAWDRNLARWVGIKLSDVFLSSQGARERFRREALAVARLSHPNIARIHRAGIEGDRTYLVLPFIEGQTLEGVKLPVRRALEVVHTIALAVDHAHRQGVVHRDLKPGNIMIDGEGTVSVIDFGLAYLRQEPDMALTEPGDVLGTAGFMSPEQARGAPESRLATTDVYGLGATLYCLTTGHPPFSGGSLAAVVRRILEEEPIAPSRLEPAVGASVDLVLSKALAKDPARRYPSARAFAADLERILAGQDVAARRPGPLSRMATKLGRHRTALAVAAGVVAIAVAGGTIARSRIRSERAAAVDAFRDVARMSLDTALRLRRSGDLVGMRRTLPKLVGAYEQVRRRAEDTSEADYLIGRMYRALMDENTALAHQQRALASAPGYGPALYERAVLLSERYGRELDRALSHVGPGSNDAAAVRQIEGARPDLVALRQAIIDDVERLQTLPLGTQDAEAVRGVLASYRRDYGAAQATLERAATREPLREEVWQALAHAATAQGHPSQAEEIYGRAIASDRGYLPHWIGRCHVRRVTERLAEAIADATEALKMDPDYLDAVACRASTMETTMERQVRAAGDLRPLADAALADFDRILAHGHDDASAHFGRAAVRWMVAEFIDLRTGRDPLPDLALAEADNSRAIELAPGAQLYRAYRGWTRKARATYRRMQGQDPASDSDAAEADLTAALAMGPSHVAYFAQAIADARLQRALYHAERGELRAAQDALAAAESAIRGDPPDSPFPWVGAWIHDSRGNIRRWQGHLRAMAGEDPLHDWALAEEQFARALRMNPADPDPLVDRALVRIERGAYLGKTRRGGSADFAAAARDLDVALARQPRHAEAWMARAHLARARGFP